MKKHFALTGISAALALGLVVPAAFAAQTGQTPTTTLAADKSSAVQWMQKNAVSQMPDWTAVATYAASGNFANTTFPKSYVSALKSSTDYSRAILGVLALGQDPHSFQGVNLVAKLAATQLTSGSNEGKFADNIDKTGTDLINNQAWAIIALEDAGGVTYNRAAAAMWLISHQNKDGGFGYSAQYSASDADDTAAAVVALGLLGFTKDSAPVSAALQYLKTQQAADGGFVNGSTTSNSDSTGVTIDALASAGINAANWTAKDGNPVSALLSLYDKASGGFNYDNTGSEWSGVSAMSTRDSIFGLSAAQSGKSVYQRLHYRRLNWLNSYWSHIYAAGGAWFNHQWIAWPQLRSMAIAGSCVSNLTPEWQKVVAAHGEWVTEHGHNTWVKWGPALANQALAESFGLDSVHLSLIAAAK